MWAIWANKPLQKALKSRPNTNKSPNLITLPPHQTQSTCPGILKNDGAQLLVEIDGFAENKRRRDLRKKFSSSITFLLRNF